MLVTQTTEGFSEPQEIKTLGVGDYFGEKALIRFGDDYFEVLLIIVNTTNNDSFVIVDFL